MSRTYEFLQDRMSFLNKETFGRYYGIKKYYQFTPKVSDVPKLEKYIIKEANDVVRGILNRPVITVEITGGDEPNKFNMEWFVGFDGMELKVECFSISEELYNLEEVENVAMWMTHMNIQELNWKQAVDKLHKVFKEQSK